MKQLRSIIFFCFVSLPIVALTNVNLNPALYNVWTIEEFEMRVMINTSIEYYVDVNPEDSLFKMNPNDKIIIIESKKAPNEIFEFRYGNKGVYHIISNEQIKWVLPKKLRSLIMEKNYYYINNDSYIRNVQNSREKEFLTNQFYWTNRDVYLSAGSKFFFDRFIYRLSSIGGIPINPSYAVSVRAGNDLLGFSGGSKGMLDIGLLGRVYEIGVQTPIFKFLPGEYFT